MKSTYKASDMSVIREKVGSLAINRDDIVQIAERGKLWPLERREYAVVGNVGIFNNKTLENNSIHVTAGKYNKVLFNKQTLEKITLSAMDYQTGDLLGLELKLLNRVHEVINVVNLIDVTDPLVGVVNLKELSNGNILVTYESASTSFVNIYNSALTVAVAQISHAAKTISGVAVLSGGGFAVLIDDAGTLSMAIYSNTGAIVLPVTEIGTTIVASAIAQISNTDIVIMKQIGANSPTLSIYSSTGVIKVASVTITSLVGGTDPRLSIDSLNGYFCCLSENASVISAVVFNDAGQSRNYNNNFMFALGVQNSDVRNAIVINDGGRFWILNGCLGGGGAVTNSFRAMSLATDGNNANNKTFKYSYDVFDVPTYTTPTPMGVTDVSAFYKNGLVCFSYENSILRFDVTNNKLEDIIRIGVNTAFASQLVPMYDCTFVALAQDGGGTDFNTTKIYEHKYVNTAILGVSLDTIAAGNEDNVLSVNCTQTSIRCNEVPGEVSCFGSTQNRYKSYGGVIYSGCLLIEKSFFDSP